MKKVHTGFEPTIFGCYLKYNLGLQWLIPFPQPTHLRRSMAIRETLREYRKSDGQYKKR